jgi:hypothetical protein
MPTKRRRLSHHKIDDVPPFALHYLSDGLFPLPAATQDELEDWRFEWFLIEGDETRERELFLQCHDAILRAWILHRPGTRPAAWWQFAAPEDRRQAGDPRSRESEAAFLKRHGLLTQSEARALRANDFKPERIEQ